MESILFYAGILGILLLGTMSPGPSFVLIARTSVAYSRADGLAAAIGMGIGGMVFSILAMLGVQAVLQSVPILYLGLKVLGGLYLINMAVQIWRSAHTDFQVSNNTSSGQGAGLTSSFRIGLFTQLSNPKTAIYYGSIFSALLPVDMGFTAMIIMALLIFFLESTWYSIVALVLSSSAPRSVYIAARTYLDRLAAVVIALLGLKLITESGDFIEYIEN